MGDHFIVFFLLTASCSIRKVIKMVALLSFFFNFTFIEKFQYFCTFKGFKVNKRVNPSFLGLTTLIMISKQISAFLKKFPARLLKR